MSSKIVNIFVSLICYFITLNDFITYLLFRETYFVVISENIFNILGVKSAIIQVTFILIFILFLILINYYLFKRKKLAKQFYKLTTLAYFLFSIYILILLFLSFIVGVPTFTNDQSLVNNYFAVEIQNKDSPTSHYYYETSNPQADMFANADSIGIYRAYQVLSENPANTDKPNALFSTVFEHYYGSTITPSPNTHYTKRFTNFATEWDLIDGQGNWLGNSFPHYSDWVQRIKDLYPFLYKALYEKLGRFHLGYEIMNDYQSSNSDFSGIPSLSNSDAIYALDKFLQSLQTGYNNE